MENSPFGVAAIWYQGDWVTRSVAMLLLVMSMASWFVIATRAWKLFAQRHLKNRISDFWHARNLTEGLVILDNGKFSNNPFCMLVNEGQAAIEHHATNAEDLHGQLSLSEWLTESLRGAIDESAERLQSGLPLLATVGSTAPFVGLFGTVWGIYHALIGIGISGQASIDKVAGPVGEALIMTAFGLAVAIPAVVGYNALTRANKRVISKLHRFARQLHAYFLTGSPIAHSGNQ